MCALENGDVVGHEALRPRVPLRIRDTGTVFGRHVEVVVLRPAWRRQVRVAHATVATDGDRVRPRQSPLRSGPRHPAESPAQFIGETLWIGERPGQRAE